MATINWIALTSRSTVLTPELNSLANAARSSASTALDNGTNLDEWGWLELQVTFGSAPSATGYLAVYMVLAPDGTNYADGSSSVAPGADTLVSTYPLLASTSAQRKTVGPVRLPPCKVKFIIENQSGQAFPASGSTLTLYTSNEKVV
jgi:hypothetical protein